MFSYPTVIYQYSTKDFRKEKVRYFTIQVLTVIHTVESRIIVFFHKVPLLVTLFHNFENLSQGKKDIRSILILLSSGPIRET